VLILVTAGCAVAAFAIARLVRWAYGDGIGSATFRGYAFAAIVVAFIGLALWRILDPLPSAIDLVLGILAGIFLLSAIRAAWREQPTERLPRGVENTPLLMACVIAAMIAIALVAGFGGCIGGLDCSIEHAGLPAGGVHVDALPAGNWE
jgi:hypothetical protein